MVPSDLYVARAPRHLTSSIQNNVAVLVHEGRARRRDAIVEHDLATKADMRDGRGQFDPKNHTPRCLSFISLYVIGPTIDKRRPK